MTPVVRLNQAVAVAMAGGLEVGLARVDELDASGSLAGYRLLPATRADLLLRSLQEITVTRSVVMSVL
jgi:RNA polymerase sigma-70 factor (ECF subfamily)